MCLPNLCCPGCDGVYGYVAPEDWHDWPCSCLWPLPPGPNPSIDECFTDTDGRQAWCSWVFILRTVRRDNAPRVSFSAPNGTPLYMYRNPALHPPVERNHNMVQSSGLRIQLGNGAAAAWRLSGRTPGRHP
jgi:hypothetical protein